MATILKTERLRLREWREADGEIFLTVTNTPAVMRHLGGIGDPDRGPALVASQRALQRERGCCFWIVERREDDALLGFCGLEPSTAAPLDNDIEIGWRLREDAWGQGFASEAAQATLHWGWTQLPVSRIVAFTVPANRPSWRVMERIGMTRRADLDFGHPAFPVDHPLHAHIVYVAERPA